MRRRGNISRRCMVCIMSAMMMMSSVTGTMITPIGAYATPYAQLDTRMFIIVQFGSLFPPRYANPQALSPAGKAHHRDAKEKTTRFMHVSSWQTNQHRKRPLTAWARGLDRFGKLAFTRSRGLRDPCSSRSSGTRDEEASPRRTAGKRNETAQRCDRLRYDGHE